MKLSKLVTMPLLAGMLVISGCTNGQIDVTKVVDGCKAACGFVPFIESITSFLAANPVYMSVDAVVKVLCASFQSAQQAGTLTDAGGNKLGAALKAGDVVSYTIIVNGKVVVVKGKVL